MVRTNLNFLIFIISLPVNLVQSRLDFLSYQSIDLKKIAAVSQICYQNKSHKALLSRIEAIFYGINFMGLNLNRQKFLLEIV